MRSWGPLILVALYASSASGQDAYRFRPPAGVQGYMGVEGSRTEPAGNISATVWVSHAHRPLVERDGDPTAPTPHVGTVLGLEAVLAYGIADGYELGLGVPLVYADGAGLAERGETGFGIGDVRLLPRLRLIDGRGPLHVTANLPISLPVGNSKRHVGAAAVSMRPSLTGHWRVRGFSMALTAGYIHRGLRERIPDRVAVHAFGFAAAAGAQLGSSAWQAMAEVSGEIGTSDGPRGELISPLEALFGLRWAPTFGGAFTLGAGTGLVEGVGIPDLRVVLGIGLSSIFSHVVEAHAPDTPPNRSVDARPARQPEVVTPPVVPATELTSPEPMPLPIATGQPPSTTPSPPPVDDRIRVAGGTILVDGPIEFADDASVPSPSSLVRLDALAGYLARPDAPYLIIIEGHTDRRGSAKRNLGRSLRRARTVREYLAQRGVDPARLTAVGYGESRPVANDPASSRQNARIRFRIATREMLPRTLTATQIVDGAGFRVRLTTDRPLGPDAVETRVVEEGWVVLLVVPQVQVERKWLALEHPAIDRALLHPSVETPPAAVVRMRLSAPIMPNERRHVRAEVDGATVTLTVRR